MDYSKEDLNKVRLKKDGVGIHEIPLHFDLLEVKPDLAKFPGFDYVFFTWGSTDDARLIARNKIIRYINFMYSLEITCIKDGFPDYKARKAECAILAGFDYDPGTGKFEEQVEKMLDGHNEMVNYMIVNFLRHSYNERYSRIVTLREKYYEGMLRLRNNRDAEPSEIMKWNEVGDMLEELEADFLSRDKGENITARLVKKIEEEGLKLRPEDIAFAIKEGRDPFDGWDFYRKEDEKV